MRQIVTKDQIRDWTTKAGLTVSAAAELCDVPLRTMEHWRRFDCRYYGRLLEPLRLAAENAEKPT